MPLITLKNLSLSYGTPPLLDEVNMQIDPGERVCLLGRNGAGKSTLLKLINGEIQADEGSIAIPPGIKVAKLDQEVPTDLDGTINEVVANGLDKAGKLLTRYYHLLHEITLGGDEKLLDQLGECQHELEAAGGWEISSRLEAIISRLQLDGDTDFNALSGGLKRRVLLARALVNQPDLLLLDEPTNHLDIESIIWLEKFLLEWQGSLLFISHDRVFLQKLSTRIIEIDRGKLTDWPGDYPTYVSRKQKSLEDEDKENALFDKKLAQEEVWIRQGIKARRTRNEGRVRALEALRRERADRRNVSGSAKVEIQAADKSGKIVLEAEDISYTYPDKLHNNTDAEPVIRNFSTTILRGDKVGIIGPNGAGKTTLIRLLLGQLEAQSGRVKIGTKLEVAYFDQHRSVLDEEKSVQDNIADGSDMVTINGKDRHVISYLRDFLFDPERARQPVKALSGGERNRLLLARLFSHPSNMLVLDEPTNDLDSDTLDLLEERLTEYKGTILLISHDRAFLDNVVTSTIVFESHGQVNEYIGGYEDWIRQTRPAEVENKEKTKKSKRQSAQAASSISYVERQELGKLPGKLEKLEQQQKQLLEQMGEADFYAQNQDKITRVQQQLKQVETELEVVFARWEELEEKASA
ncbi:MAG: ATP-binding cassette domain-containing protein [Xanthomonadales bacterium]|nr:ATP-binding cassette domain-containing protein [Xanthomonadales bacterium]